ncbi:hypothetical protein [Enterococcus faecium]|uniref:hypothetical protein n=1 Tax=Enterococcus faecium TaxID=1352 RepID=UPI001F219CBB|nr:hypothetical protein [Enterococcus faecium]MCF8636763.1 hypothetical protein [Enterococcus faecium]HAQ5747051.1 hypothetical protein [Enterococcus faecium]
MLADKIDELDTRITNLITKQDWEFKPSRESYIKRLTKEKFELEKELNRQKGLIGNFL